MANRKPHAPSNEFAIQQRQRVSLRADACIRVVVIADTHGALHSGAIEAISKLQPQAILHAGDMGDDKKLDPFRAISSMHAVRGNIDGRLPALSDCLTLDIDCFLGAATTPTLLTLLMVHYGLNGPRIRPEVARMAKAADAALVVCGHSHIPFIGIDNGLAVFNPGSIGPKRFRLPITFGVLEISDKLRMHHVDVSQLSK
jgi:hypothetical protein